jgi:hypothetical protein
MQNRLTTSNEHPLNQVETENTSTVPNQPQAPISWNEIEAARDNTLTENVSVSSLVSAIESISSDGASSISIEHNDPTVTPIESEDENNVSLPGSPEKDVSEDPTNNHIDIIDANDELITENFCSEESKRDEVIRNKDESPQKLSIKQQLLHRLHYLNQLTWTANKQEAPFIVVGTALMSALVVGVPLSLVMQKMFHSDKAFLVIPAVGIKAGLAMTGLTLFCNKNYDKEAKKIEKLAVKVVDTLETIHPPKLHRT